jgi:Phage integrase family
MANLGLRLSKFVARSSWSTVPVMQASMRAQSILHSPMAMDKLAKKVIRPAIAAIGLPWYRWHGFRRGVASNLYALGADDKVVQRILRHANPHVTKECYIKVFDPAVLEAVRPYRQAASVPGTTIPACCWPLSPRMTPIVGCMFMEWELIHRKQ